LDFLAISRDFGNVGRHFSPHSQQPKKDYRLDSLRLPLSHHGGRPQGTCVRGPRKDASRYEFNDRRRSRSENFNFATCSPDCQGKSVGIVSQFARNVSACSAERRARSGAARRSASRSIPRMSPLPCSFKVFSFMHFGPKLFAFSQIAGPSVELPGTAWRRKHSRDGSTHPRSPAPRDRSAFAHHDRMKEDCETETLPRWNRQRRGYRAPLLRSGLQRKS
jgi:hypothetical protein